MNVRLVVPFGLGAFLTGEASAAQFDIESWLHKKEMADRVPMALSPDGQWMAVMLVELPESDQAVTSGPAEVEPVKAVEQALTGSEVVLVQLATGEVSHPFAKYMGSYQPCWSPDSKTLALLIQTDLHRYPRLALWSLGQEAPRVFDTACVSASSWVKNSRWTGDGQKVVFFQAARPRPKDVATPLVEITGDEKPTSGAGDEGGGLGVLDVASGHIRVYSRINGHIRVQSRLVEGVTTFRLSPNDKSVAFLNCGKSRGGGLMTTWVQLVVGDLDTGTEKTIGDPQADSWATAFSWSPDGTKIAWRTDPHQPTVDKLFVADVEKGTMKECAVPNDFRAANLNGPGRSSPAAPLWDAQGQNFFVLGKEKLLRYTASGEAADGIPFKEGDPAMGGADWLRQHVLAPHDFSLSKGENVLLIRRDAIQSVNPATDEFKTVWPRADAGKAENLGDWSNRAFDVKTQMLYTARVGARRRIELVETNLAGGSSKAIATLFQGVGEFEYGQVRHLTWKLPSDGSSRGGTLLLPTGWKEGDRPPVVMWVYGGNSAQGNLSVDRLHDIGFLVNPHFLSANGYAYLSADMPEDDNYPALSIMKSAEAAAGALRESGLVDDKRIAVMGSSYGGYSVLCILTGSKLFRAGIAANGIYDLIRCETDGMEEWVEHGQGRMGGTVWEKTTRYIENSPFFALSKLDAPVLILSGADDPFMNKQSTELREGLQCLGKSVEMLTYRSGGHAAVVWPIEAQRDMQQRLLKFLERSLAPADSKPEAPAK